MTRIVLCLILVLLSKLGLASTWIGNGGSVMDTELRSTLRSLKAAARSAPQQADKLCTCGGTSDQCALLDDLSEEKVAFCSSFILKMSPALIKLIDGPIKFRWSSESLKASQQSRDFDAIAQPQNNLIIINEVRFARMKTADRLQLLAHELLHFVVYEGQRLGDDMGVGAFAHPQGGRQLLDSAGAAYVIVAMNEGYIPLQQDNLSRPFRNLFLWGLDGSRTLSSAMKQAAFFSGSSLKGSAWGLTWYPRVTDNLGWKAGYYEFHGAKSLKKVQSAVQQYYIGVGPEYRLVPFSTGMSFWDSIQLSAHVGVGYGRAVHELSDDFVHLQEARKSAAGLGNLRIQLPLIYNFWLSAETGFAYMPYEMKNLNIANKSIFQQNFIGVSYGVQY